MFACTGLALGVKLSGLQWRVKGVMLAGPWSYYRDQQHALTASFAARYLAGELFLSSLLAVSELWWSSDTAVLRGLCCCCLLHHILTMVLTCPSAGEELCGNELPLDWVERSSPRRFGKIFREDVTACQQVSMPLSF